MSVAHLPEIRTSAPIPTWFGVGGGADRLTAPASIEQLGACLESEPRLKVLGDGANLLVDDDGVSELVVVLDGPEFGKVQIDAKTGGVYAGAAAKLPALIKKTSELGLAGLETLAGFPATVGGAVVMNAGGRYGEISQFITHVHAVDRSGRQLTLTRSEIPFSYRHSGLNHLVITGARFQLIPDDPARLKARRLEVMEYKRQTQPLAENSAGCCFKNPTLAVPLRLESPSAPQEFDKGARVSAGLLIDRAGCKGLKLGSAEVSPQHGNFITAAKHGCARDVINLIHEVQRRVLDAHGVQLETEVVIWRRSS
ncbi:MAG TPA: UDP-N-acetylmuramate dehydrogenase [Phycisphaerales bacterium]|nr:UDP-N-acetylmuramate dehydrogenase [Phycisphaerales bacterium]